jgi:hypothetical protein
MDEARRNQVIAQVKTELALVDSTREMCAGADSNINGVRFYEVALVAARTGNDDALTCLLEAPRVREMTSAKAAQIDQEAMALGQASLQRGSWDAVRALSFVYTAQGVEGQTGLVSHLDMSDGLRMSRLMRLGTANGSPDALRLDQTIAIEETRVLPEQQLSGQRWANEAFHDYFARSGAAPPLDSTRDCGF